MALAQSIPSSPECRDPWALWPDPCRPEQRCVLTAQLITLRTDIMQTYMKSLTPFFICLLFLFPSVSSAQVFTGGSASFSFLNNRNYLEASPLIGYRINDFREGTGAILSYNRRNGNERTHYGARIFGQYDVAEGLYLHGEMEGINTKYTRSSGRVTRNWLFSIPVGAGYRQRISENVYATASILYDLIQHKNSPYDNPIIRGGVRYYL